MPRTVHILLSTHNGERYLAEQLDSLLAQTYVDWRLSARDDGSADTTCAILEAYARRDARISVVVGENLGVFESFYTLLEQADPSAAYYAFCDQDDVWLPDKLERAVAALEAGASGEPTLYCARALLVDESLRPLSLSRAYGPTDLANALVENIGIGCSMLLDRQARDMVLRCRPSIAPVHDWWCLLVVAATGRVIYDATPRLWYRQHGGNAIGGPGNRWTDLWRNVVRFGRRGFDFAFWRQAEVLLACYGDRIPAARREVLVRFVASRRSWLKRLVYALTMEVRRQSRLEDWLLRALIVANRY